MTFRYLFLVLLVLITGSGFATVINVPSDYPTIQEGVDSASVGDTVLVANGTYSCEVIIDKSITLMGMSMDSTVLDGGYSGNVITIVANAVTVRNLKVQRCGPNYLEGGGAHDAGILIHNADSCLIQSCRSYLNPAAGVALAEAEFNTVMDCQIHGNLAGIAFVDIPASPHHTGNRSNQILNNSIFSNTTGMDLTHTLYHNRDNLVEGNLIASNHDGIRMTMGRDN